MSERDYEYLCELWMRTDTTKAEQETKRLMYQWCLSGFSMHIKSQEEWGFIAEAVNVGIDSHLEAFTRSTFDANTGKVWIDPDEMHILIRRMVEIETREANELYGHDPTAEYAGRAEGLVQSILYVLCTPED